MVKCTKCNTVLSRQMVNTFSLVSCPSCRNLLRVDIFPALFRALPGGKTGDALQAEKESSCFYHPRKKAIETCTACGRFVCALCDVELNGLHLCPLCLEKGKAKGKIKNLEDHRTCYDTIALFVAFVPIFPIWIITAPIVMFMSVRYWKAPSSIIPRTKIRFILAFGIALLQIVGFIAIFTDLFSA